MRGGVIRFDSSAEPLGRQTEVEPYLLVFKTHSMAAART